jgi:hypothetical protein
MVDRDPEKFLSTLSAALHKRLEGDASIKPQWMFFSTSKSAVSLRLSALDSLAEKFPQACVGANTDLGKRREQDQILFDFFANALASFESFCCASYFVGAVLDPVSFPAGIPVNDTLSDLRQINPTSTLKSYKVFASNSEFTKELQASLFSDKYTKTNKIRNLLLHRLTPGRTILLSTHTDLPHRLDLDLWFSGDLKGIYGGSGIPESKLVFDLPPDCLTIERDWVDKTIDGLAGQLTELAMAVWNRKSEMDRLLKRVEEIQADLHIVARYTTSLRHSVLEAANQSESPDLDQAEVKRCQEFRDKYQIRIR